MSYEQNSKLYPDYRAGVTTYHNADTFFGYEAPEDLQEFLQEQNISDATVYVEIGNKKVPFVKGHHSFSCGDPNCYSLATNYENMLEFNYHPASFGNKKLINMNNLSFNIHVMNCAA